MGKYRRLISVLVLLIGACSSSGTGPSTSATSKAVAFVTPVQGHVASMSAGATTWDVAVSRTELGVGSSVLTGSDGVATIDFVDGSRLLLQPSTALVVTAFEASDEFRYGRVAVLAGGIGAEIVPKPFPDSAFEFEVGGDLVLVKGSALVISIGILALLETQAISFARVMDAERASATTRRSRAFEVGVLEGAAVVFDRSPVGDDHPGADLPDLGFGDGSLGDAVYQVLAVESGGAVTVPVETDFQVFDEDRPGVYGAIGFESGDASTWGFVGIEAFPSAVFESDPFDGGDALQQALPLSWRLAEPAAVGADGIARIIFDGPDTIIFDGPDTIIFDGPDTIIFDGPDTFVPEPWRLSLDRDALDGAASLALTGWGVLRELAVATTDLVGDEWEGVNAETIAVALEDGLVGERWETVLFDPTVEVDTPSPEWRAQQWPHPSMSAPMVIDAGVALGSDQVTLVGSTVATANTSVGLHGVAGIRGQWTSISPEADLTVLFPAVWSELFGGDFVGFFGGLTDVSVVPSSAQDALGRFASGFEDVDCNDEIENSFGSSSRERCTDVCLGEFCEPVDQCGEAAEARPDVLELSDDCRDRGCPEDDPERFQGSETEPCEAPTTGGAGHSDSTTTSHAAADYACLGQNDGTCTDEQGAVLCTLHVGDGHCRDASGDIVCGISPSSAPRCIVGLDPAPPGGENP